MPDEPILRVAVPAPLRHPLDYLPPAGCTTPPRPGMRVVVPLAGRRVVGVVLQTVRRSQVAPERLRRALDLPDAEPLLPPDILDLCLFAARYYHAPPGEAVVNTLPAALRTPGSRPGARVWEAAAEARALPPEALRRAPRQAEALAWLLANGPAAEAECLAAGHGTAALRALAARGFVRSRRSAVEAGQAPAGPGGTPGPAGTIPELNEGQSAALAALAQAPDGFRSTLLEGVTGSGKTEVYLRLVERVLAAGRQALVLVPEIGLTPQTGRRFAERFGAGVGLLHSGLGDRERLQTWRDAAAGRLRVLIGTRSALFTPMPALGLIVVDEEHDASFKQQEGFRYSARDLAVYRAQQRGIPIVLGSATPSTETLANCLSGRFAHLVLPQRAGNAEAPRTRLVDVRGAELDGGMGAELIDAIEACLQRREQVLVFLNRRGWAPVLSCGDCGWMGECGRCDARLTLHRAERLLWCHHCDARQRAPSICPGCNSARLVALGTGTERTEHTLQRRFPGVPVHRIDRGTMQGPRAMDALIDTLAEGEPCILVGTQMLAKGHHFPGVTLVAIVDLDGGLFSSDFRAAERTGQLLVQVAGRAGRAERTGEVLLQTLHPGHPWLERLLQGGYRGFIEPVLAERERLGLPPFGHLAVVRVESPSERAAADRLRRLRARLQAIAPGIDLVGPVPPPLARRAGRYRMQLLLRHARRAPLHAALEAACRELDAMRLGPDERWHLDVDPVEGA